MHVLVPLLHAAHEAAGEVLLALLQAGGGGAQADAAANLVQGHVLNGLYDLGQVLLHQLLALHGQRTAGTNGAVDAVNLVSWPRNEGGAGVSNGCAPPGTQGGGAHLHALHLELPVALAGDWHPDLLSYKVLGVHSAQHQLATIGGVGVPVEPEAEDRLLHQALVHHIGEGGDRAGHRNGGEAHAQDAIKLSCHEGETRLIDRLRKALVLNPDAPPCQHILTDEAIQGAGAVLNGKLSAVGLVCS
mmetsp:Transcript_38949/g.86631  ORF Transcript_38949/g.86631 Transcript_38949/m.86631 type:complete len:245 (-) Transcript_38949:473-1207(-)